jgi:hypothetical protein
MQLLPRIDVDMKLRIDWPTPAKDAAEVVMRGRIQRSLNAKAYAMSKGFRELLEVVVIPVKEDPQHICPTDPEKW